MKLFLVILFSSAVLFLALSLGVGYYMYRFAFIRVKKARDLWTEEITNPHTLPDEAFATIKRGERFVKSLEWEHVSVMSHDGLSLVGHLAEYLAPDGAAPRGIFLMVHGYKSSGIFDFSGAVEDIRGMGFSLLIIDHRAHGESEGEHICFGVNERRDVIRWAEYLRERYPALPVVLDGVSMGAATIAMGGELGYPDNVRALVCDCGYTTAGDICRTVLKRWFHLPPFPIYHAAKLIVKLRAGIDLDGASAALGARALCERGVPILIAHGKADGLVPYYMAEEIYAACIGNSAELFAVEGADHGLSYLCEREAYIEAMGRLFKKAGI